MNYFSPQWAPRGKIAFLYQNLDASKEKTLLKNIRDVSKQLTGYGFAVVSITPSFLNLRIDFQPGDLSDMTYQILSSFDSDELVIWFLQDWKNYEDCISIVNWAKERMIKCCAIVEGNFGGYAYSQGQFQYEEIV